MTVGLLVEWIANVLGDDVTRLVTAEDIAALLAVMRRAQLVEVIH